jgi:AcrR family transcriptional regulator
MMDMKYEDAPETARPYRQTARAEAAEATARRIAKAFGDLIHERWFEDVTLDEVARRADVTVRTIIRRFGSKEGLLGGYIDHIGPEIAQNRTAPPGDVERAVARVIDLYEKMGDGVIRNLAQELRYAALRPPIERGRKEHRKITEASYSGWLEDLSEKERRRTLDALVVATDIYTWKLVRRDMGRSRTETEAVMLGLVNSILDGSKKPVRRRGGKK